MNGAGRYAKVVEELRRSLPARGIVLLVVKGPKGDGFEVAMPPELLERLPGALREVADVMEADIKRILDGKRG